MGRTVLPDYNPAAITVCGLGSPQTSFRQRLLGLIIGLKLLLDGAALVGIGMTARRGLKAIGTSGAEHE